MMQTYIPCERNFDRRAAAEYLTRLGFPVAPATLARYASSGQGPAYRLFGRKPVYVESDLLTWLASRLSERRTVNEVV